MKDIQHSFHSLQASPQTTLRALLVEDKSEDAEAFITLLQAIQSFAWEILHVKTLADACKHVSLYPFDIVFLDLNLPDATGANTVKTLVSAAPTIPIIVLTAVHSRHMTSRVLQLGAEEYNHYSRQRRNRVCQSTRSRICGCLVSTRIARTKPA